MHKTRMRIAALCLAAVLLLTGCSLDALRRYMDSAYGAYEAIAYEDMAYTRPDMVELQNVLASSCSAAQSADTLDAALTAVYDFYDVYDSFYTNYNLADIRYCGDLTDIYWEAEYNYCAENIPAADAALETLYRALAKSPMREALESEDYFGPGYFDAYEGESVWDEYYLSLMEQEAALQSRYYDLSDQALSTEYYSDEYYSTYGTQMAELFVELVALRQEIAAYAGYASYPELAYDLYFYRDYTPAQAESYLTQVSEALYKPYCHMSQSDVWNLVAGYCTEAQTFQYVKDAASAMGGTAEEAFALLEEAGLYDIRYGENKYDSSFEVYLWSYYEPFIFMCPYMDQTDKLTFAHEFGHFANDYVCGGSYAGTDIAEVHSQAFEYLSLCYSADASDLSRFKMADSLCTYMESGAYALFEHQVYGLTGDKLTVENVAALYEQIGRQFGFDSWDWDSRDFVTVPHFFTNPMYMVSYVVSNDLAMQFYQLEQDDPGAGLALYEQILLSQDSYIVSFAQLYGLESPFSKGRLQEVAETFQHMLG